MEAVLTVSLRVVGHRSLILMALPVVNQGNGMCTLRLKFPPFRCVTPWPRGTVRPTLEPSRMHANHSSLRIGEGGQVFRTDKTFW